MLGPKNATLTRKQVKKFEYKLPNYILIMFLGVTVFSSAKAAQATEVNTWFNQSTSIFIDKLYSNDLLPKVCWTTAKPELVAKGLKPLYLRIGLFDGQDGEFPCLTEGFKKAQKGNTVEKLIILKSVAIACSVSKQGTKVYYPEKILCTTLEPIKSCLDPKNLPAANTTSCIDEIFQEVADIFENIKESAPTMFVLFGNSSFSRTNSTNTPSSQSENSRNGLPQGHLGPIFVPKEEGIVARFNRTNSLKFPEVLPIEIATEPFVSQSDQEALAISLQNSKDDTTIKAPVRELVKTPVKPTTKTPAIKETPRLVRKVPQKPLTLTQLRYQKHYTHLPVWAKKVHETAIRALSPIVQKEKFVQQPGACSQWVREVFQAALPDQSHYLDVHFFGGTAAGIDPLIYPYDSTLYLWDKQNRIRTISQVMKYGGGLRPGDIVFQNYGFGNSGHVGIVIINHPIYARNNKNINMNDSFVIAENTQRHCRLPAEKVGCPWDNRGIVSIQKFGHLTHVGRYGGFGK